MAASMGRTNLTRFRLNILTQIGKSGDYSAVRRLSECKSYRCRRAHTVLSKNQTDHVASLKRNLSIENSFQRLCIRLYSSSEQDGNPPSSATDTSPPNDQVENEPHSASSIEISSSGSTSSSEENIQENKLEDRLGETNFEDNIEENVMTKNLTENKFEENLRENKLDENFMESKLKENVEESVEEVRLEENSQEETELSEKSKIPERTSQKLEVSLMYQDPDVPAEKQGENNEVIKVESTEEDRIPLYSAEEAKQVEFEDEPDILYIRIDLHFKSVDRAVLKSYLMFLQMAAEGLDVQLETKPMPKYLVRRDSLLKSVHVYKKHYRQYERRTHILTCSIHKVTGSTASVFLEYIQRNLPEGIAMQVEKHQLEMVPEHLKRPIKEADTASAQD